MTDVGEPTGAGGEKDLIADSGVVGTEAAVVRRMRRRRRRMATNVVLQIFAMIAIGMLVYPQGADWPRTIEQSVRLLLSGLEKRSDE